MTLAEIVSIVQTAAEVASFLGVPYASDVAAAAGIAPQVIADATDAISRIRGLFGEPIDGNTIPSAAIAVLEPKHLDALTTFQSQWSSYSKLGRNPIDAVPGAS